MGFHLGQITNGWELDATGVNYRLKSRFSSFQNVPELLSMYRSFADVVTKGDLDEQAKQAGLRPLTPPVTDGKPFNHVVERSEVQARYMTEIIDRMEHLPKDPRIDNPLKSPMTPERLGWIIVLLTRRLGTMTVPRPMPPWIASIRFGRTRRQTREHSSCSAICLHPREARQHLPLRLHTLKSWNLWKKTLPRRLMWSQAWKMA